MNFHQPHHHDCQYNQKSQIIINQSKIQKKKKRPCIHWTSKENVQYLAFLISNEPDLGIKSPRKIWKIYKLMSQFIQTRDVHQCRSHHKKMIRKHDDIKEVIEELKIITPQNHLAKALKQYNKHFIQQSKQINKSMKHALENEKKIIQQTLKVQADQEKYYLDLQDEKKYYPQNFSPVPKHQQNSSQIINSPNQQNAQNYQFMPPCIPFMNSCSYYFPAMPSFFIYHH